MQYITANRMKRDASNAQLPEAQENLGILSAEEVQHAAMAAQIERGNYALHVAGSNHEVSLPYPLSSYSIALWVKGDPDLSSAFVYDFVNDSLEMIVTPQGRLRVFVVGVSGAVELSADVNPEVFNHIVLTVSFAGDARLYVNGVLAVQETITDVLELGTTLAIGDSFQDHVPASIASFAVWDAVRDADQVSQLYKGRDLSIPGLINLTPENLGPSPFAQWLCNRTSRVAFPRAGIITNRASLEATLRFPFTIASGAPDISLGGARAIIPEGWAVSYVGLATTGVPVTYHFYYSDGTNQAEFAQIEITSGPVSANGQAFPTVAGDQVGVSPALNRVRVSFSGGAGETGVITLKLTKIA